MEGRDAVRASERFRSMYGIVSRLGGDGVSASSRERKAGFDVDTCGDSVRRRDWSWRPTSGDWGRTALDSFLNRVTRTAFKPFDKLKSR
jgi:hypothetical protein